ncbi:MAG: Na(+)-translocating NADH-quinone reductase subunit C [Pirellulaceae bacterium]
MFNKDNPINTVIVAGVLCLVCSAIVSVAAIGLKPIQDRNKALDKKKNVLIAAGLMKRGEDKDVEETFKTMIEDRIFDFVEGKDVTAEYGNDVQKFDAEAETEVDGKHEVLIGARDIAQIKKRENRAHIYIVKKSADDPTPTRYVFPIRGRGLWSTMKGFLALDADLSKAGGITFYEDQETPGLGGEINSAAFQNQWPEKVVLDDKSSVVLRVVKNASKNNEIDALSGATITSNGVQNSVTYWLGPEAYGKFISSIKPNSSK